MTHLWRINRPPDDGPMERQNGTKAGIHANGPRIARRSGLRCPQTFLELRRILGALKRKGRAFWREL